MSTPPEPQHLSNHQRNTLREIFQHPVSHNIEWRSVVSLLETVGSVTEHHDGKLAVTLGPESGATRRVLKGVRDGERVVLSPPDTLRDGDAVKVAESG